jgi:hypothetical protein
MPELEEKGVNFSTTDVTLTTTTETVVISSGRVPVSRQTCQVLVKAWCQLVTGAATTTVTPRIRRGQAVGGALVGEANAETLKAAAAGTEPFVVMAVEDRADVDSVEYSLTLQQASATGNGTVKQALIEVEILGG